MSPTISVEDGPEHPTNVPAADAKDLEILHTVEQPVDNKTGEAIVAPDQFDARYETSRKEIWSYYACVDFSPWSDKIDILTK